MHPDSRTAERLLARDADTMQTVVHAYAPQLWTLAYRLLQDECKAEDAVQETFLKGWRCLEHYQGTGSLLGWFKVICRRHCLDEMKRRSSNETTVDFDSFQTAVDRNWEADALRRLLLRDAFAALPEQLREP